MNCFQRKSNSKNICHHLLKIKDILESILVTAVIIDVKRPTQEFHLVCPELHSKVIPEPRRDFLATALENWVSGP